MDNNDLEKIIRSAHKKLVEQFMKSVTQKAVTDYLKFCFSHFSVDHERQKYQFSVQLNLLTKADKNRYWTETDSGNRVLVERDPKTGEESIIISVSYQTKDIYRSQLDFDISQEVELLQSLDVLSLKKKPSFVNKLFGIGPKQLYADNPQWEGEFLLKDV
jgi:hypothetical protein